MKVEVKRELVNSGDSSKQKSKKSKKKNSDTENVVSTEKESRTFQKVEDEDVTKTESKEELVDGQIGTVGGRKKKKRKKVEETEVDEKTQPDDDISETVNFSLADVTEQLCENPPEFLDVRDEQLSLGLLGDMERDMLDDMIGYFLIGEGVKADEKTLWGPAKWKYSDADEFDNFDFYAANGCPNCGASYELDFHHSFCLNPPALVCRSCGHRACPIHFDTESESIIERLEGLHHSQDNRKSFRPEGADGVFATSGGTSSQSKCDGSGGGGVLFSAGDQNLSRDEVESEMSRKSTPGAVYVRGSRVQHYFGQNCKEWWQSQFLPRRVRLSDLHRTMTMIGMMSKLKAPTIDEVCDVCGNTQAYFHTYQARSADEGMTIMYECTRCHARKIFNN